MSGNFHFISNYCPVGGDVDGYFSYQMSLCSRIFLLLHCLCCMHTNFELLDIGRRIEFRRVISFDATLRSSE